MILKPTAKEQAWMDWAAGRITDAEYNRITGQPACTVNLWTGQTTKVP